MIDAPPRNLQCTAPPYPSLQFPLIVQLMIIGLLCSPQQIPPPSPAEFALIVQFLSVRLLPPRQ